MSWQPSTTLTARWFEQAWPSLPYNDSRFRSRCSKAYAGFDVPPSIANTPALLRALAEANLEFIETKAQAGRPKDKVVLPLLVAALEEQQRNDE
jgi:hypothetical protein